jgi:hypothetical protein
MRKALPLSSYQLASVQSSPERLVNCFVEQLPPDAKGPVRLTRAPGITEFADLGDGPVVEIHYAPAFDKLYVVSGEKLYSVSSTGASAELGTVGAGRTSITSNTASVAVCVSPNVYTWDGATFAQVTDADFNAVGALNLCFLDNYLVFPFAEGTSFGGFDLGSSSSYDALSFATPEGDPDKINGIISDHRQLFIGGQKSIELWDNTGASGFPFERGINAFVEQGVANGETMVKCDNTVMWLANDQTYRRLSGVVPVRFSQHGIEDQLRNMTISSAKSFDYQLSGHINYVSNFDEATFVYDATTQLWHERQSYGYDNWRGSCHAEAWQRQFVGDRTSGKVGYINQDAYDEFGDTLVMQWTYQPVFQEGRQLTHNRLEAEFDVGVGTSSGTGSDPQVSLEYSDDGGKTWNFAESQSLGALGNYGVTVVWSGLGTAARRVYRMSVSDPVNVSLTGTWIEADIGGYA